MVAGLWHPIKRRADFGLSPPPIASNENPKVPPNLELEDSLHRELAQAVAVRRALVIGSATAIENIIIRLVEPSLESQFETLHRGIAEGQGDVLHFLVGAREIAILVIHILAAQRQSPLVIDRIVDVRGKTTPLGIGRSDDGIFSVPDRD